MDSDATLDGEVDHSFFDSDGERPPRAPGPGQGQGQGPEKDAEDSRTASSTACSSCCSSLSSGRDLARYRTKSQDYASDCSSGSGSSNSSSGRDEAGDRAGRSPSRSRSPSPSPQTAPAVRWLHSRAGLTRAEQPPPLSVCDSDSDSSSDKRRWRRTRPSAKTRTGRSRDLCRPTKRPPGAGAVAGGGATERHEDEHSTVTDVTPLSSPARSPVRPHHHHQSEGDEPGHKPCRTKSSKKKQENVSQAVYNSLDRMGVDREKGEGVHRRTRKQKKPREGKSCNLNSKTSSLEHRRPDQRIGQKILNDATDLNQLLRAMLHLERKELRKIVSDFPEQRQKKNYTFNDEEAKRIDRENQRLLHELTRKATRPPVKPKKISAETVRVYHSTLNRQREQERIERENLESANGIIANSNHYYIKHGVIHHCRWLKKAGSIIKDPHHPDHTLISLLRSGRRYRSLKTTTTKFRNNYFPTAIRLLNSARTKL